MKNKVPRWDAPCDEFQSPVHLSDDWLGVEPRRPEWRDDLVCERCGWPKSAHSSHQMVHGSKTRFREIKHHH
jgi:hypothetical protein